MTEKLKQSFSNMIVMKNEKLSLFSSLNIPSYIRDWFLKRYQDDDGDIDTNFIMERVKQILPRKDNFSLLLDKMMNEGAEVTFLAKIKINLDIKDNLITFDLPDFGITKKETYIFKSFWDENKKSILNGNEEVWGIISLKYQEIQFGKKSENRIVLTKFQSFKPYKTDLSYYKEVRKSFSTEEWINVLLGAMDYNSEGFKEENNKLAMLKRLLPFVEKRLNLIELAPKGTGKSYVFSQISKYGWLNSGGVMTRAKMFYDMRYNIDGLVANNDFVVLDEIATIKFPDMNEMQGAMKGYLESGTYTVGVKEGSGDAGVIFIGNIKQENMNVDENMFSELPEIFNDSALLDRFHGFIEGWDIPRMNEGMKANGWALNSEYFSEILHLLREDITQMDLVDKLIACKNGDTRDIKAIKKITCAHLKLLFPHWLKIDDVNKDEFIKYCLNPAVRMRGIIKKQLGILDVEYKNKSLPEFEINL